MLQVPRLWVHIRRLIQINLNNCEAAQHLLSQTIREKGIDVVIVCEPYRNCGSVVWTRDQTDKAAILACSGQSIQEVMQRPGFVRATMDGIHVYSCYAPPSATRAQYDEMLPCPENVGNVNIGNSFTFRGRGLDFIVDLTYVSTALGRGNTWHNSEHYTHSDHHAIFIKVAGGPSVGLNARKKRVGRPGRMTRVFELDTFSEALGSHGDLNGTLTEMASRIMRWVTEACDAAMPRRREFASKQPLLVE